ncbi:MAG: motility protein A [Armatimonadia bacterium]|nr:motility protein A [Armatimonadia bacterium]
MNPGTIIGLVFAIGTILGSALIDGTHLTALMNTSAAMVVFGGTFGAATIMFQFDDMKRLPKMVTRAFVARPSDPVGVCSEIVTMAQVARRDGFLGLEREIPVLQDKNPFLARGLQMVADGTTPETVMNVLHTELRQLADRHRVGATILESMGALAPTLGVTGTVMHLIHVMAMLDDPSSIGPAIAAAFLATLYGVASANVIFIPLGGKLKTISKVEQQNREIVIEGVRSIQRGDNPILVAETLKAFLPPGTRDELTGSGMMGGGEDNEQARAA